MAADEVSPRAYAPILSSGTVNWCIGTVVRSCTPEACARPGVVGD